MKIDLFYNWLQLHKLYSADKKWDRLVWDFVARILMKIGYLKPVQLGINVSDINTVKGI